MHVHTHTHARTHTHTGERERDFAWTLFIASSLPLCTIIASSYQFQLPVIFLCFNVTGESEMLLFIQQVFIYFKLHMAITYNVQNYKLSAFHDFGMFSGDNVYVFRLQKP